MAVQNRSTLKSYFQRGDKPTEAQFSDLVDSMLNYADDGQVGLSDYNPAKTYNAGQGTFNGLALYKANKSTTGIFNAGDWDSIQVGWSNVTGVPVFIKDDGTIPMQANFNMNGYSILNPYSIVGGSYFEIVGDSLWFGTTGPSYLRGLSVDGTGVKLENDQETILYGNGSTTAVNLNSRFQVTTIGGFALSSANNGFYGIIKSDNVGSNQTYQLPANGGTFEVSYYKGIANGYAALDASGKVPLSQLPAGIVGSMQYQGKWNASTNTPALASGVGTTGYFYIVGTAGTTNIDGNNSWNVGDWIVFDGTAWDKIDNYEAVTTVFGRVGNIILLSSDVIGALTYTPANAATTFVNGGNSFGSNATLGTNDNYTLAFKTNNITALALDTSQNAIFSGQVKINNALSLTGSGASFTSFNLTTGSTTNNSNQISFDSNAVVKPGDTITGTGIPIGTYIISTTGTTALISANATATNTGLTFTILPITYGVNFSQLQTGVINQSSAALYLNPSWTNQSIDNRALYINYQGASSSIAASPVEIASSVENMLLFRAASNTVSAATPWQIGVGNGFQYSSGYFFIASKGSTLLQASTSGLTFGSGVAIAGGSSSLPFLIGGIHSSSSTGVVIGLGSSTATSTGGGFTVTSGAVSVLAIGNSSGWANNQFAPTSGSASYTNILLDPIINQTVSATGTIRGIYYNPNPSGGGSILGTHYAIEATSGIVKISDSTAATSITTGALQIPNGGMSIGGSIYTNGSINMTNSAANITASGGGIVLESTVGGNSIIIRTKGDSNGNNGAQFTKNGNIVATANSHWIASTSGTFAHSSTGSGLQGAFKLDYIVNQTSVGSQTVYGLYSNPTLSNVLGIVYGIYLGSNLIPSPTGGGSAYAIYSAATAPSLFAGTIQASGYNSRDGSSGVSGSWTTVDGKTIIAKDGIITSIV